MPTENFKGAAKEITRLLFLGTEWNVESIGGRDGNAQVLSRIIRLEIPKIWPEATPEQMGAIAIRLPVLNYLRDDRAKTAAEIEALLREHVGVIRGKAPASRRGNSGRNAPPARGKKRI